MIVQNPLGVTPTYELDIGGVSVDYLSIDKFELSMNESEHDLLTMRILGIPPEAITDYIHAPVRFELRRGTNEQQLFTGQVIEVIPTNTLQQGIVNDSPFQVSEIRCLGSSYKMRGARSKVWGEQTLTDIAVELANKYRFSIDVPKTFLKHTDTVQINKSDWSFLNELCDTYGYCLNVHGTHIHVWDPYKATGRQISYHVLKTLKTTGGDPRAEPGVILSFNGTFSSSTPTSIYTSVLDAQGNITTVTSDALDTQNDDSGLGRDFNTQYSSRVHASAKTIAESELAIRAYSRSFIPFKATIEVFGLMEVYPGGLVRVDGFNSKFDGLWYVMGVNQVLGGLGLITTLYVVSDSTNEDPAVVYSTQRFMQPPDPVYFNGEWVATTRKVNVYN